MFLYFGFFSVSPSYRKDPCKTESVLASTKLEILVKYKQNSLCLSSSWNWETGDRKKRRIEDGKKKNPTCPETRVKLIPAPLINILLLISLCCRLGINLTLIGRIITLFGILNLRTSLRCLYSPNFFLFKIAKIWKHYQTSIVPTYVLLISYLDFLEFLRTLAIPGLVLLICSINRKHRSNWTEITRACGWRLLWWCQYACSRIGRMLSVHQGPVGMMHFSSMLRMWDRSDQSWCIFCWYEGFHTYVLGNHVRLLWNIHSNCPDIYWKSLVPVRKHDGFKTLRIIGERCNVWILHSSWHIIT